MTAEYFGKIKPQRLTSLEEDLKKEQTKILADQARFKKYGTNKQSLADLKATNQLMPASELKKHREALDEAKEAYEESVRTEESHQRTKRPSGIGPVNPIYSREPFEE